MVTIVSPHFGEIEISGENEQKAAEWLTHELNGATKAQEMLAHRNAILHSLL